MKKKLTLIFLFSLFNLITGYSQKKVDIKVTILKNGFIFDDKFDLKTGSIIIKGNQIADILYTDNFSVYPEATIIDITRKYVMPGLIDTHVHLATAPNLTREKSNKYMEDQLSKMIYAGITTVRDMTGNAIILADYKQVSTLNQLPAPSIFYAAQFAGPDYFNSMRKYTTEKDTPWQRTITDTTNIKMVVAEAKGAGVTGIKIYNDLSARMIRKIVKKAKKQGLQSWSHAAVFPATPTDVAAAKVNSMSHAFDIPYGFSSGKMDHSKKIPAIDTTKMDKLLLLMKANNVILDATNYMGNNNKLFDGMKITKRAHELGVKVSTGTDWPYLFEKDNIVPLFKEIKILTDSCGFTNKDVLISATKIGAESIGVEDRGVIAVGKRADLYITNSDPVQNIENLKDGFMTVKSGIIYKKE
ncbi:amidohydrolase family protein [Flavobacterium tructae]|uniref:Hydrolase n=2 Tax=Flavobacterium tructae TaxID=1114873 RepID=A0A1S1J111_9FLAO|nr:amidohydrolase family protein [Flavobacterium tructae]OHT43381.1 hydrolase [Flavobacterium tructae]OXB19740.1 hydrolase [Flavobacterium tructae]